MAKQQNNGQEQDVNQLRKVRREKLADLQQNGKDPFQITKFNQTHHSLEVKSLYEAHEAELLKDHQTPDVEGMDEEQAKEVLKKDYNFKKIAGMVQTRIETFPDIPALIDFFEEVPEYDSAMYCHKKMKTNEETSLTVLKEVLPVLEEQEDYTNDPLFETLSAFVKEHGYKNGYVMWPLRTAVSGKQMTPAGATEIMEIIGKDETIKRVKAAIEKLSK